MALLLVLATASCRRSSIDEISLAVTDPAAVGQWSPLQPWPELAIHAVMLPTGKVMWWPEKDAPEEWDPDTGLQRALPHAGYDLFCGGHAFLADGRLLATGGQGTGDLETGLRQASTYDPFTSTWTLLPLMNAPRWYPTNTTLPTGDALVIAGSINATMENPLPQIWQVATGSWRNLTNAQRMLPTYPWMFVAPNGKVFDAGPQQMTTYLDPAGAGSWANVASRNDGSRYEGTSAMYAPGRVLVVGGVNSTSAIASAEVIDLNAAAPAWRRVGSMHRGRSNPNATLLPDGKVLVTGGNSTSARDDPSHPVLEAEVWDPATQQFTLLAPASSYRGYHSTAVLLPDGRVLYAGGLNSNQRSAQVFSPPYLFLGPRPVITSAPSAVDYGQSFLVDTPNASDITQVTWIRLTAVTHAFNQNQRFNRLAFSQVGGQLSVTAPDVANEAPPGHYMLFILNGHGVPSVAAIVRLGGTSGTGGSPSDGGVSDAGSGSTTTTGLFKDDFNRTGGLGASWTVTHGAFSANGAAAVGTAPSSYAFWRGQPDVNGTVAIKIGPPIASTYYGVIGRANPDSPDRDHYAAYVQPNGVVGLARRDTYVYTNLGTGPHVSGGMHELSLTATGTAPVQLSVKLDGVEVVHATDNSAKARSAGMAGIFDYNGKSQPLDDFTVHQVASSPPPPPPPPPDGGTSDGGTPLPPSGVVAQDDFTTNGVLGPSWHVWSGGFTVSSGAARSTAARSYATMGAAVAGDVHVSAVVTPSGLNYSGVLARAAGDRDHYVGWINQDGSVHLARRNSWVYTYLADATPALSGAHKLTLRVQGTGPVHLTLYVDDNPVIDTTDSGAGVLGGAGGVGIFAWQGAGPTFQHFLATQP